MTDTTNAANSSPITAADAGNTMTEIAKAAWDEAWNLAFGDGLSAGHPLGHSHLDRDTEWADSEVVARIAAAPQPQGGALTDEQIAAQDARYAIDGAIAFGRMGTHRPPAGHWLTEYWGIGQQLAELGKSSAWDNQTPVTPAGDSLTDEQIIALADRGEHLTPSPTKYPELGHGTQYSCGAPGLLGFVRAILAQSAPSASAPACTTCNGFVHVHDATGEYRGECPHCAQSAPQQAGDGLTDEQRDAIREVMQLARDEGLPGTAETLQSILAAPRQPGEMGAGVPVTLTNETVLDIAERHGCSIGLVADICADINELAKATK